MRPVEVSTTVDTPRELVFDHLCDIANHAAFSDHYLEDFRLQRIDSRGVGASACFRMAFPLGGLWGDCAIAEVERPFLIRMEGRMGRVGRIRTEAVYRLTPAGHGMTSVEYEFRAVSASAADRLKEALGLRAWLRRQSARALRRLAAALEQDESHKGAVGVAAG